MWIWKPWPRAAAPKTLSYRGSLFRLFFRSPRRELPPIQAQPLRCDNIAFSFN